MADLTPIPMGIPWDPWDPSLPHSHAHLYPTWLLGPTQVCPPNGMSVGSSVFAGLAVVSNTQTHAQTLRLDVRSNRPHLVLFTVLAMRLNVDECRHEGIVLDNEDNLRTNGQNS